MISDWCISLLFVTGKQGMTGTLLLQDFFFFFFLFFPFGTDNSYVYQTIHYHDHKVEKYASAVVCVIIRTCI